MTLFIENFLTYGVINALDKVVPLAMLPLDSDPLTLIGLIFNGFDDKQYNEQ